MKEKERESEREREREGGREGGRERTKYGYYTKKHTELSSYGILHDPIDKLTARRGIGVHRIQGSSITIPLFTNIMVNLHE